MGRAGLEPAEPEGTRFTVWPATSYGIPTQNGIPIFVHVV